MFLMHVRDQCSNKLEATGRAFSPLISSEAASSRLWTWARDQTTSHGTTASQKVRDSYPSSHLFWKSSLTCRAGLGEPLAPSTLSWPLSIFYWNWLFSGLSPTSDCKPEGSWSHICFLPSLVPTSGLVSDDPEGGLGTYWLDEWMRRETRALTRVLWQSQSHLDFWHLCTF